MIYFFVGLGGIVGALLRYVIGNGISALYLSSVWATLPINLTGCFILGAFNAYVTFINHNVHPWIKAGFGTGLVGSYTTFSTFSVETMVLLQDHRYVLALTYVLISLWCGLGAAWLGSKAAEVWSMKDAHAGGG